jgi:hypoxanthine phosphoribosyltransferase
MESGYQPDFLVGLSPGGWVLSRIICDYLDITGHLSLKAEDLETTDDRSGMAEKKDAVDVDLAGRRVLLVDDISDTGRSLKIALDYLKMFNPGGIRTATLLCKEGFVPDFHGDKFEAGWVVFPWDYTGEMCSLVSGLAGKADNLEDAKSVLRSDHGVELSGNEISRILREAERRGRLSVK